MNGLSAFWSRGPELRRTIRLQRETDPGWAQEVAAHPGCEGLFSCLQCGTCSGTCPVSSDMDLAPHTVIALVREGFREDVLTSRTIWLCASCYSCDVDCPSQIHLTDIMGTLRREAVRRKLHPHRLPISVLEQELCQVVSRRGSGLEFWRVFCTALRSNPLQFLTMIRTGWRLVRNGRPSPRQERIKNVRRLPGGLARPDLVCFRNDQGDS